MIKNNHITEIQNGYGIYIDNSTCHLENNLVSKNSSDGVYITSNANFLSPQ